MEVAKTFDRNGIRYRPGDALPPDLDTTTLAHYHRHGMVREARTPAPAVKKPAARKPQAVAKPLEEKTAAADSAAPGTPGTPADGPDLTGLPSAQEGALHA